jgi:hypothetical protein
MKPLLILGSARCLWDDVAKARSIRGNFDTMAVNLTICHWEHELKYAASWHSDRMGDFVKMRTYRGIGNRPITYAPKPDNGVDFANRCTNNSVVTSGMYAMYVALHLGYDKIVAAGIPFDKTGNFYQEPGILSPHVHRGTAKKAWKKLKDESGNRIKVVSGSLVDYFGEITKEWLAE